MKFIECDTCRPKPGHPVLCSGCLHNRMLIERLKSALQQCESYAQDALDRTDYRDRDLQKLCEEIMILLRG